jgi:hypothetical protein
MCIATGNLDSVTMKSLCRFALAPIVTGLIASATAQNVQDCEEVKLEHNSVRLLGTFSAERSERFYCLLAKRGQRMRITVNPQTSDLNTQGSVRFPQSDLEPGGPGGVVFDEPLPTDGIYRIRITQRYGEKNTGLFELVIDLR